MNALRLSLVALLTAPIAACSCGEDPLSRTEPPDPGVMLDAGFLPDAEPAPDAEVMIFPDAGPADSGVPEARVLTFDGTSPLTLYYGATRDLRFLLRTAGGQPVAGETIMLAVSGSGGALSAATARTDATGAGTVRFTAANAVGRATITASADRAPSVSVVVDVREDPNAQLTIDVRSNARITVASADALVYVGTGAAVPTCAQLAAATVLPTPTFTAAFAAVPGSSSFSNLASGASVTVLATGETARGDVVARGCTDGARLVGATNTRVVVTLEQLPTDLDGDYDALLQLDIGATIPPPVGPTIVLVTTLLSDPAGWVVYQTLREADQQFGSVFVQWTPPGTTTEREATFDEVRANPNVFNVWRITRASVDGFLTNQFGQQYTDLVTVGADIEHLVRRFEVGAELTVTATGTPGRVAVDESWQALVFQWQRGCPAGDLGCARRPIELSGANANLAPARAGYGATVVHTPFGAETERFVLQLDQHQVVVRYGAIVMLALNQIVFPNLPPAIAGNNLTQVVNNIVDCPNVAASLSTSTGLPAALFQGLCDTAVATAVTAVENRILALDSANNPSLVSGLSPSGGGELVLVDADHDLVTETVESMTTYASWTSGQNVTTPITGHGRRAAAGCVLDGDCGAGLHCVPVPSYLEVRALEQDCRRPSGTRTGPVACTQDADCASGLCFDAGARGRLCYVACNGASSCATGTCTADAAAIDLDPVLAGLGDATISACVP
ncbi:Ig-like domain-containing protein [Myxococcota bacterium]|nr:Ig-like domain-containing protein [Myxococcota bacterium]